MLFNAEGPSLSYCERGDCLGLPLVFPSGPSQPTTHEWFGFSKEMDGRPTTQEMVRGIDGVRFVLKTADRVAVVHWLYGDPWWSTVDMVCGRSPEVMQLCCAARLLRDQP